MDIPPQTKDIESELSTTYVLTWISTRISTKNRYLNKYIYTILFLFIYLINLYIYIYILRKNIYIRKGTIALLNRSLSNQGRRIMVHLFLNAFMAIPGKFLPALIFFFSLLKRISPALYCTVSSSCACRERGQCQPRMNQSPCVSSRKR